MPCIEQAFPIDIENNIGKLPAGNDLELLLAANDIYVLVVVDDADDIAEIHFAVRHKIEIELECEILIETKRIAWRKIEAGPFFLYYLVTIEGQAI